MWCPPPLPIDWACACRSGIWNWIFQWLGKSLILKRRFAKRCGIKGIGSQSPYNGSQTEVIHSALLAAFYWCPLEEARAPREGQYKSHIAAFMMFTLTSAHFLTKWGLLLLSFCTVRRDNFNLFWQAGLALHSIAALPVGIDGSDSGVRRAEQELDPPAL